MNELLNDLLAAKLASQRLHECPLCLYIRGMDNGTARDALTSGAAGSIGINKLERLFQKHKIPAGRRTIVRHRKEGHKP